MTLQFRVRKTPEFIFNYLTDMQKFVSVHPVIHKIEHARDNHFLMHETLKFGFIPFSFKYPATVEGAVTGTSVIMKATVMKLTKIEMKFEIKAAQDCTMIEETVHFKSWLPVKGMMRSIFREQHALLFKNIDALK